MSRRAAELAEQFMAANDEVLAVVEMCSDKQWHALVPGEERSVGVVAHHIAGAYAFHARYVRDITTGQMKAPTSFEDIAQGNAAHATKYADCTREEVVERLRRQGTAAADLIRGLDEAQLQRTGVMLTDRPAMSVEQIIARIMIGHIQDHFAAIRMALAAS